VNCLNFVISFYNLCLWQGYHDWRTLVALVIVGMIVSLGIIPLVIRTQRRAAVGQNVYESGPAAHLAKQGTPTMGGLAFPLAAIAGAIYIYVTARGGAPGLLSDLQIGIRYGDYHNPIMMAALIAVVGVVGFIDDFMSIKRRTSLGLRARFKLLLLIMIAVAVARGSHQGTATDYGYALSTGNAQWWFGHVIFLSDFWYYVLAIAAVVGCANAVNLADGVDGLAGSVALPPLLVLLLIGWGGLGVAVAGALVVFLFFNRHPAKVFMGDTGSLTLGALLAILAINDHMLLYLPLLGIVFVAETLSVIAQVISFKLTGKRIFKMSPLHHHFELSGWSERRVTWTFSAVSVLASISFCAIVFYSNLRIPPH
jgi:phospho-N-acetylmuramoyl-pentapeptide-transferase